MEIQETLRNIGFSEYEIKIYLCLNKLETATANEISKDSTVPRNKVYEIIENMVREGFVMELLTKPKKYRITSLDKLKENVETKKKELNILENETDKLVEKLKLLNWGSKEKDPLWIIKGQKNIVDKIAFEMNMVEHETLSVFRNNVDNGTALRNTRDAVNRGVKVRMIGCVNEKNVNKIKRWIEIGVDFRVYNEELFGEHGTRFTIFDDKKCRITIGKPEIKEADDYITSWIESPSLVRYMKFMFYSMWDKCLSFEEYCRENKL